MFRALITISATFHPGWVPAQTFTPLFDGASLAGWTTQGQGTWEVRGRQTEVFLNGTRVVNHTLARVEAQGFFAFQVHDRQVCRISLKDIAVAEAATAIRPRRQARPDLSEQAGVPPMQAWDLSGRRLPPVPAEESFRYILDERAGTEAPDANPR